jgi:hypothetical protein
MRPPGPASPAPTGTAGRRRPGARLLPIADESKQDMVALISSLSSTREMWVQAVAREALHADYAPQ